MAQKSWTLFEGTHGGPDPQFSLTPAELGISGHEFHVRQTRLRGGLREGVDAIEIDNGRFGFIALPTRGMGIWKAWLGKRGQAGAIDVGWQAPVEGPVHPQFVPVFDPSGVGWLEGFDELLVRCGLESNGAPDFDSRGFLKYGLHGRIANRPADRVELTFDDRDNELRLTGVVEEARFLFQRFQLRSTISTRLGEPGLRIHDEVINLGSAARDMQLLYHQLRPAALGSRLAGAGPRRAAGATRSARGRGHRQLG